MSNATCSVEDCDHPKRTKGLCKTHYQRLWRRGRVDHLLRICGSEEITYDGAHRRVRRKFGPASNYMCNDCDEAASNWSFMNFCTNPFLIRPDFGSRYCPHPEHYVPRCSQCHKKFDRLFRSGELPPEALTHRNELVLIQ